MISKTRIRIILASAMVASAVVYTGIAHRHHQIVAAAVQPAVQTPQVPKPAAGTPLNATTDADQSETDNDANAGAQQQSDTADDQHQVADDGQPDAGNADQGQAAYASAQQTAVYAAAPVHRIARVRVVRVLQPAASVETASVDRPVTAVVPSVRAASSSFVVPTGTPLTLRLDEPLGSKISQVDQSFSATLDSDVEVNGHKLIASGAHVTGRVLFARPAGRISGEATLQLAVTSVKVRNREFDVVTSPRSFGPTINGKNRVGRFMKGIAKRIDGEERDVLLAEQTGYTFNLSSPLEIR